MSVLTAPGFPEELVRERARSGAAAAFPDPAGYGASLLGHQAAPDGDPLDAARLVPPVFVPDRLEKLYDLGREPTMDDVELVTDVGGLRSPVPFYVSAFGSTAAARDLGHQVARQAGRGGVPMVIGENVLASTGSGRLDSDRFGALLHRVAAYADVVPDGRGGVVVQQSTEDADGEVWNLVYTDPSVQPLLATGRLAFELKVGQGAKPGLGGMTLVSRADAGALADRYLLADVHGPSSDVVLRSSSPGTFTAEILRQQVRLMRNNYPRCRVWVKLSPARDVASAAAVAWEAGADAVTVDGAEAGTGWAPGVFLARAGLPLGECLARLRPGVDDCLLASGRIWEGARAVTCLALGARALGLGRAALLAVDEDPELGLTRLLECLALEVRMLTSALGRYRASDLAPEDVWHPAGLLGSG
ncbi:glutamate synthase-related protein [Cellulomonas telluris]|uniref:glutamate synthase-related protein n=1 Tax=Cellulomonas telluris TaxID=2306636 RepID=UPI0010A868F7|nr:glutamate synthase-related protein [Cellulomonas telluris]